MCLSPHRERHIFLSEINNSKTFKHRAYKDNENEYRRDILDNHSIKAFYF